MRHNALNGRFLKGGVPFNAGLKWDEYMDPAMQERCKRGWENLRTHHITPCAGWNKKAVIGIRQDGRHFWFESATAAAKATGLIRRNISHCCNRKRKSCSGWKWFFFDDDTWISLIKQ